MTHAIRGAVRCDGARVRTGGGLGRAAGLIQPGGRLGGWEVGRLGGWEVGRLGQPARSWGSCAVAGSAGPSAARPTMRAPPRAARASAGAFLLPPATTALPLSAPPPTP